MSQELRNELLYQGLADMLQLSWIISVVSRHVNKPIDDPSLRTPTLEVIQELLESGYAIAGDVVKDDDGVLGVRSWGISPSDTVARIAQEEWASLDDPAGLGEGLWLELTAKGKSVIRVLSSLRDDEYDIVNRVIERRRPEYLDRLDSIGQYKLLPEERRVFRDALLEERADGRLHGRIEPEDDRKLGELAMRALVF